MAVTPVFRFSEFAPSGTSPSGSRHLTTHPSYVKQLGVAAGQYLDFGSINIQNGKQTTGTKAVVAVLDDMKDANNSIYNMKFWISNNSAFNGGTYYFNGFPSGVWLQNLSLNDASGRYIPTALPSGQNIWRQDGGEEITASGLDSQVTQYIYLSFTGDIDVPVNIYGGDLGGWVFRLTFDFK
jgi:hypothetical protein